MGAVELVLRQIAGRLCEVCNGVEDDDAFCRLIYRFYG